MTFFGYVCAFVILFSSYIGYRIFLKILIKKEIFKQKRSFIERIFLLSFICLLMVSMNAMCFILSYSFFWEKAFRTLDEQHYEATVIGYEKVITKTQNFRNYAYYNKSIYFPKVKYISSYGDVIIKTLDITSNNPPIIGQRLKITDKKSQDNLNAIELNWIMFICGCAFIGVAAFFTCLLSTYITEYTLKRRIALSIHCGFIFTILNVLCIILIYLKQ